MNRLFKVSLFLLAFLAAPASYADFKPTPFVAPPGEPIKTIALLKIGEPRGYFLGEGGVGGATLVFGTPGLFFDTFKKPKHPEYEQAGFRFSTVAERLLTEHLQAAGFNVISVPVERKKPYKFLRNYKALSVPNVDAYLDLATGRMGGVGYRKSKMGGALSNKVGPYVVVFVQLVSARSKEVLYADSIEYGWRKARVGSAGIEIDAPDDQVFEDTEAVEMDLMLGDRSRSLAQLTHGIDVVMRRVVSEFSAYPATGRPLQAGATPGTESPIEVSRAAPAATLSPDAATTTWTQTRIKNIRSIAGQWSGTGKTARGENYSVTYVFKKNGSVSFSFSGEMGRKSGRRSAGALSVSNGKMQYTHAYHLWTIALFQDTTGKQELRGRREDGDSWQLNRR